MRVIYLKPSAVCCERLELRSEPDAAVKRPATQRSNTQPGKQQKHMERKERNNDRQNKDKSKSDETGRNRILVMMMGNNETQASEEN